MITTKSLGNFGEQLARDFLQRRGYVVLASNIRLSHGEIDVIAKNQNRIIFVEVKTLLGFQSDAEEAISRRQILKLKQIIAMYCRQNKINFGLARLDFIAINLDRNTKKARIRHYPNIS
jgi:putative endonuclease